MRPARHQKFHEAFGIRFERSLVPVSQAVENATIAAWNAAAEDGSLDLGAHLAARRARTAAAFRDGLDPAHYVALTRGRLQTLFGNPASRGDDYKSSFEYDVVAETPQGRVYFRVSDHKASDVLIFWEYSTSTPEARRLAEQAFWALVVATPPSQYEDAFAYDDAAGVRYGYRAGRPWLTSVAALPPAPARKSARMTQPTGHVSLLGILSLALGAVAAVIVSHAAIPDGALPVAVGTSLVAAVGWGRAGSGGG